MKMKTADCWICSSPASQFARHVILGRHEVAYYVCGNCGFVQTEEPYWLEESYSDAITKSDLGLVSRNLTLSKLTKAVISLFFNSDAAFLDYGGGYGLLVRLMRDLGLDFYRYDEYCPNLFAQGFDAETGSGARYELLTAFEVFEHLASPMEEVRRMLELSDSILFSTELCPGGAAPPGDWWYLGLDHGQHVSFYTPKTLSYIADKYRMNLYSYGSTHLLTKKRISSFLFRAACRRSGMELLCMVFRRESLLQKDWLKAVGREG